MYLLAVWLVPLPGLGARPQLVRLSMTAIAIPTQGGLNCPKLRLGQGLLFVNPNREVVPVGEGFALDSVVERGETLLPLFLP